jgi:hypothetical protein
MWLSTVEVHVKDTNLHTENGIVIPVVSKMVSKQFHDRRRVGQENLFLVSYGRMCWFWLGIVIIEWVVGRVGLVWG